MKSGKCENVALHSGKKLTAISVCTGVGMLDQAVIAASGGAIVPLLYVEREAYVAALLADTIQKGGLPDAPVWSDLQTITGPAVSRYIRRATGHGKVDVFYGGIPCQPWSHVGKRSGSEDVRDLWPPSLKAIKYYEPGIVWLEEVSGFATHLMGLRRVIEDLESMGYCVKAGFFDSETCGASNERLRLFVIAAKEEALANTSGARLSRNANEVHLEYSKRNDGYLTADGLLIPRYAPGPDEYRSWESIAKLDPALMPVIESEIYGVGDGLADWNHRVRSIGNGVDALAAGFAFVTLWACLLHERVVTRTKRKKRRKKK